MENTRNFDRVFMDQIHDYLWQAWENQFAASADTTAGAANEWKIFQSRAPVVNDSGDPPGRVWAVDLDPFANAL